MGGKKHHLWGNINPGEHKNYNDISNPFDRHAAFISQMQQPFCNLCGKIIDMGPKEEEHTRDWRYEMQVGMHQTCMQKEKEKREAEARAEARRKEEEPKESLEDIIKRQYGLDVKGNNE